MMKITVFRGQNIDVAILASVIQPSVWDLWWKIAIYHDNAKILSLLRNNNKIYD